MAKGPGGRAATNWTPSRNRKLVRLYTLTQLTKKGIRKVLKAKDFDPCERTITNQLKILFPKDYTKHHRAFRPSDNANMGLRLACLHRCKDGRVSKFYGRVQPRQTRTAFGRASVTINTFEGTATAFRNYMDHPSTSLTNYLSSINSPYSIPTISARLMLDGSTLLHQRSSIDLDQPEIQITRGGRKRRLLTGGHACDEGYIQVDMGSDNVDSPRNCPFCKMAVLSTISPQKLDIDKSFDESEDPHETSVGIPHIPVISSTSNKGVYPQVKNYKAPKHLQDIIEVGQATNDESKLPLESDKEHISSESESTISQRAAADSEIATFDLPVSKHHSTKAPSISSLKSLKNRLSSSSSSYIYHVHNVMRLSFSSNTNSLTTTRSWRSSWTSATTKSSIRPEPRTVSSLLRSRLLKSEEEVWNELIDDSQFDVTTSLAARPEYLSIAPNQRPCCIYNASRKPEDHFCKECGSSCFHALAAGAQLSETWLVTGLCPCFLTMDINDRDNFGNTLLHYIAASGSATWKSLVNAISKGVDILAKNTSGETFMHVLKIDDFVSHQEPGGIFNYLQLVRHLEAFRFPFDGRDCHGRAIAHLHIKESWLMLASSNRDAYTHLLKVLKILKPDLETLDNLGNRLGDQVAGWSTDVTWPDFPMDDPFWQDMPWDEFNLSGPKVTLSVFLSTHCRNKIGYDAHFRQEICSDTWDFEAWPERLRLSNLITWVDVHGDTPLTAILKEWRNNEQELHLMDIVQQLIELGVDVNMRDRKGYTALAIATIRGSRPCVAKLLALGAMPNSRNYRGSSIIHVASKRMERAKKQRKDICYARILACITLLIDYGGLSEPTEFDEWLDPSKINPSIETRKLSRVFGSEKKGSVA